MQFHQRQFTRSTQLALREHGFYISQRDGRGQVDVAVELPYEELLPLRLEYRNTVPHRQLLWSLGGLLYVGLHVARPLLDTNQPLPEETWLMAFGVGVGLIVFFIYGLNNWWHQAVLHTSRLQVVLADHPRDRRQLRTFVANLQDHTKSYLRREYGLINPLGLIEPQLRRLAWLHELDVLSTTEAQALATRLTGRLPGRGIKSMGQRLEAPYVN